MRRYPEHLGLEPKITDLLTFLWQIQSELRQSFGVRVPESGTSVPTVPPPQQFPLLVIHKVNFVQGQQDLLKTNCWWRTSGGIKVLLHGRCQLTWLEGWKVESNQLEGMIEMCCVLKVIR